jgi:hypothetical protein
MSNEMNWEVRERDLGETLWWCRNATCEGAGYGRDIHAHEAA